LAIASNGKGFTLVETVVALGVAAISVIGAYGLVIAIEKHYRSSAVVAEAQRQCRIAMERMFKDISETSNETITIAHDPHVAISFASARDANGNFQSESYGHLGYGRPVWQKAVVYYVYEDTNDAGGSHSNLYRKEIPKTNWSSNYNPIQAIDANGEVIAENIAYVYFDPTEITIQDHILNVYLELSLNQDKVEAGPIPEIRLNTGIPILNRQR
jgi:type II secretory pathway pseudopilin PulG